MRCSGIGWGRRTKFENDWSVDRRSFSGGVDMLFGAAVVYACCGRSAACHVRTYGEVLCFKAEVA